MVYRYVKYALRMGFIEVTRVEEHQGGLKVKFYKLTDKGRKLLELITSTPLES